MGLLSGIPAGALLVCLLSITSLPQWTTYVLNPVTDLLSKYATGPLSSQASDLLHHNIRVVIFAAVYFVWALYNVIASGFDLGVVTFALALLSAAAAIVFATAIWTVQVHHKYYTAGGCWAVSANYFLGTIVTFTVVSPFLMAYFIAGTIVWFLAGYRNWTMTVNLVQAQSAGETSSLTQSFYSSVTSVFSSASKTGSGNSSYV